MLERLFAFRKADRGCRVGGGHNGGKVLDINVADVKATAPVFHKQSVALSDALTTLVKALDGYGKPWGDDEPGRKFGHAYSPQQKKIESATGILVLGLDSIYEALQDMADGHVDNDRLVAGIFTEPKTKPEPGKGGRAQ
jgi:uncharacterized protein YukE